MRSIVLHVELDLPPRLAPMDLFSLRDGKALFLAPSEKHLRGTLTLLDALADLVDHYAGRLRVSISMSGATARGLGRAGAKPVIEHLMSSGCIDFGCGTQTRISVDGVEECELRAQIGGGAKELEALVGPRRALLYFGDGSASLAGRAASLFGDVGIGSALYHPRDRESAGSALDVDSGMIGVPIATLESQMLGELLNGRGIPGQVAQEIRNLSERNAVILSVSPSHPETAAEVIPRLLHALLVDPRMRMLTHCEYLQGRCHRVAAWHDEIARMPRSLLHLSARQQLLGLAGLLPVDPVDFRGGARSVLSWHTLLARSLSPDLESGAVYRRVSGSPVHDRYIQLSTAIATVELNLSELAKRA